MFGADYVYNILSDIWNALFERAAFQQANCISYIEQNTLTGRVRPFVTGI